MGDLRAAMEEFSTREYGVYVRMDRAFCDMPYILEEKISNALTCRDPDLYIMLRAACEVKCIIKADITDQDSVRSLQKLP